MKTAFISVKFELKSIQAVLVKVAMPVLILAEVLQQETRNKSLSRMKYKAHGTQQPRQYTQYGEVVSTTQRSNSPAQTLITRFPNKILGGGLWLLPMNSSATRPMALAANSLHAKPDLVKLRLLGMCAQKFLQGINTTSKCVVAPRIMAPSLLRLRGAFGLRAAAGFTLLELLLVIAVIGIIGGIVMVAMDRVSDDASVQLTQTEMQAIARALRQFKHDVGYFPDTANAIANNKKLALLYACQASTSATTASYDSHCSTWDIDTGRGWHGPYLSDDGYKAGATQDNSYQDAWGTDYQLVDSATSDIRIVSAGPDKTLGTLSTGADICKANTSDAAGKDNLVLCLLK